nr:DUF305 domain-containing protein [Cellulomonas septica]
MTLVTTLVACAGGDPAESAAGPDRPTSTTQPVDARHDETDTWFAQMMVVHHEGAIEMAELAADRAVTPEVRDLARRIADAQGPEIALMSGWLAAWDEDAPDGMDHGGMDHGGMDMHGMGQDEAMGSLDGLEGVAFDRAFLDLMIAHHRGAVTMAETELADGTHPDAMRLARTIVDDQTAEITEMQNLLNAL